MAELVGSCLTHRGRERERRVAGCRYEPDLGALKMFSWNRENTENQGNGEGS